MLRININMISGARGRGEIVRRPPHGKCIVAAALASALALIIATLPISAEAGAVSTATRGAIAKRGIGAMPPQAFGKRAFGKPRDVIIERSKHPQAAAHIDHAQKNGGQPTILHVDRTRAAERRSAAIGTVNPKRKPEPHWERDEYPPAFTREGGHNASVRFINPHDNRGAGSSMGAQTRDLPNGAKIRVLVK